MRKIIYGLAPALLAIGSGAAAAPPEWRVSEISGDVRLTENGRSRAAAKGALLASGSTIATGARSRAVIVRGEEFVVISPATQLRVPAAEAPNRIMQIIEDFGTAVFKINKKSTPHFGVQTPYLAAVVKGTTFTVTVGAEGGSVQVTEGAVEVSTLDGGAADLVTPGEIAMVGASDLFRLTVDGDDDKVLRSDKAPAAGTVTSSAPAAPSADYSGPVSAPVQIAAPLSEAPQSLADITGGLVAGKAAVQLASVEFVDLARRADKEPGRPEPKPDPAPNPGNGNVPGGGDQGKPDKDKPADEGEGKPDKDKPADEGEDEPDKGKPADEGKPDKDKPADEGEDKPDDGKDEPGRGPDEPGKAPGQGGDMPGKGEPGNGAGEPDKDEPGKSADEPGKGTPGNGSGEPGKGTPGNGSGEPGKDEPGNGVEEPGKGAPGNGEGGPGKDEPAPKPDDNGPEAKPGQGDESGRGEPGPAPAKDEPGAIPGDGDAIPGNAGNPLNEGAGPPMEGGRDERDSDDDGDNDDENNDRDEGDAGRGDDDRDDDDGDDRDDDDDGRGDDDDDRDDDDRSDGDDDGDSDDGNRAIAPGASLEVTQPVVEESGFVPSEGLSGAPGAVLGVPGPAPDVQL